MKKRLVAVLMAAAMAATMTACGGSGSSDSAADTSASSGEAEESTEASGDGEELSIVLRGGTYADVIKACLPAFEEEHNCTVEVMELSEDDLKQNIALDALNAEGSYDMCMVDGSWMAEFTENEVLADLKELGYDLDDDIIEATKTICYSDDKLYLAPYYGNVTVLLLNKANVEEAGYATNEINTLDDILTICKTAQENGKKGFIYRGDTANNLVVDFMPILLSYGGWVVDDNNQPTVNTPEFQAAMEYYLELIATGDAEVKDDLIASCDTGAGTMGVGWPGWYTPTEDSAADYVAITGVASEGDEAYNANVYGIWTIGVPANSQHKELAAELVAYLMDADVQLDTVSIGGVPCRYSSLQNEDVLAEYPQYEVVCQALEGGVYRPVMAEWGEFCTILGAELDNIVNGVSSVEDGLQAAQEKLEDLVG
ncbi:MAG: extracellular solute-binding protein [Lachnospiraceae bacterium]|nr:extracellular solute-binding protein [Lachnospiraceae bacterium]